MDHCIELWEDHRDNHGIRWDDGEMMTPFFRWLLTKMVCMALLHG